MPIIDQIIRVLVSIATGGLSKAGFGTLNNASYHTAFTPRIQFYSGLTAVALDFEEDSKEYLAASAYFSQSPRPTSLAIGRLQQDDLFIDLTGRNAYDDTHAYKVTIDDVDYTATSEGSAALTIDELKTLIDAAGDFTVTKGTGGTPDFVPIGAYKMVSGSAGTAFKVEIDAYQDWMTYLEVDLEGVAAWVAGNLYKIAINDVLMDDGSGGIDSTGDADVDATIVKILAAITTDAQVAAVAGTAATGIYYIYQKIGSAANTFGKFDIQDAYQSYDHGERGETWTAGLNAIKTVSNDWFGLASLARSEADVLLATAWAEANDKIYGTANSDPEIKSTAVAADTGSIAKQTHDLAYFLSFGVYHSKAVGDENEQWIECAAFGKNFTVDPDVQTSTWKFSQFAGITPDILTDTERQNILGTEDSPTSGKNWNVYTEVAGANIFQSGQVVDGEWIDTVIIVNWYKARLTERLYGLLVNTRAKGKKVPMSQKGITAVVNEIIAQTKIGITTEAFAFDPELDAALGFLVEYPLISDISAADKAARIAKGFESTAALAGAIHAIRLNAIITVPL